MENQPWTDDQIKQAIQKGGRERSQAEEYWFKFFYVALFRFLVGLGATNEEAEEAIISAFYKVLMKIAEGNTIENLKNYLYVVARNEYYHLYKSRNRRNTEDIEKAKNHAHGDSNLGTNLLAVDETQNELEKMGEPCRTILLMKGLGHSDEEILNSIATINLVNPINTIGGLRNKVIQCRDDLKKRLGGKPY